MPPEYCQVHVRITDIVHVTCEDVAVEHDQVGELDECGSAPSFDSTTIQAWMRMRNEVQNGRLISVGFRADGAEAIAEATG